MIKCEAETLTNASILPVSTEHVRAGMVHNINRSAEIA
jgi:hypothetical protein